MKTIAITKGREVIVDNDDFNRVAAFKWKLHPKGYAFRTVGGTRSILMHRFIVDAPRGVQVDHRSGDKLDNRRDNLRLATGSQNQQNRSVSARSRSGYKGLRVHTKGGFQVRIKADGRLIDLGYFKDAIEAALAYDAGARKYHGDFARLNFPGPGELPALGNQRVTTPRSNR